MHKIAHATAAFAKMDGSEEDALKALDQALRHLTQRIPVFRPSGRDGRADLFSTAAMCALRLCYIASCAGFERARVESLANYLLSDGQGLARREDIDGGQRPLKPIAEAMERIGEGQVFDLNVVLHADGQVVHAFDWQSDDPETAALLDHIFADAETVAEADPKMRSVVSHELARTIFPASHLIAELIETLGAE